MAPISNSSHDIVEDSVKRVIDELYFAMTQVHAYDTSSRPGQDVLQETLIKLSKSIQTVHKVTNQASTQLPEVPPELIQYVDNGRNPDIYTREFVEYVRKGNQLMKGKMEAFGGFRDVLAQEMARALPEVKDDILDVVEKTGGNKDAVLKEES